MKYCLSIIFLILSHVGHTQTPPVVKTTGGLISGTASRNVHIFKGIPFAAPPVGELRWRAPQPVNPWTGIKKCEQFGPSPMQPSPVPFSMWSAEFLIPKEPISEDCLYLNVWSSIATNEKKPVLVWIYGGGFVSGGSAAPIYDGEAMAEKGVVFVSINYRVGVFGFFAHPQLNKETNFGLMDQVAALQWVQNNIEAFGGDKNNVTIAGQSAGAISVMCLMASPLAKGLFAKAVVQSGAGLSAGAARTIELQEMESAGEKIFAQFGVTDMNEAKKLPAEKLLQAKARFAPVADGYLLPDKLWNIFSAGLQNKVPLLVGANQDEDSVYALNALNLAKLHSPAAPVYLYRFTRQTPGLSGHGAFHSAEIVYAFNNLKFLFGIWQPVDHKLTRKMNNYWVNFAKAGNPNGRGLRKWPAFDNNNKSIIYLGEQITAKHQ